MQKKFTFVTGYFGAPVKEVAEKIAEYKGWKLLSLDDEIEKSDGRSVQRICMLMGEHEYRNKEYEILAELTGCSGAAGANENSEPDAADSGIKSETKSAADECAECGSPAEAQGTVVYCGDGVLNDEMSREIILKHELVVIGDKMTTDELWERACGMQNTAHAFMYFGDEEEKKKAFEDLLTRERALYEKLEAGGQPE